MISLFDLTVDEVSFGFKATWTILALVVAFIFSKARYGVSAKGFRLMTGVMYISISCALAQGYWATWRFLRAIGQPPEITNWFLMHGHFEAFILIGLAVGYSYHLGHVLEDFLGKNWLIITMITISSVFAGLVFLPKVFI